MYGKYALVVGGGIAVFVLLLYWPHRKTCSFKDFLTGQC